MMTLYSPDDSPLMQISAIERSGNELLVKGKVFGTMPLTARLKPSEARKGLGMLRPRLAFFLLTLLLRKD
jgi:hypothetical protein